MKLVPNWKNGWRWLSVHLMALGAAFTGAWLALPDSMRSFLPDKWGKIAALLTFIAGLGARFINQPAKSVPPDDDSKDHP